MKELLNMEKINKKITNFFNKEDGVVFVHAHPDDESFLTSGLMQKLSSLNRKCLVVYTSAGIVNGNEKGLTKIRQAEALEACSISGVKKVEFLPYCDKRLAGEKMIDVDNDNLSNEIIKIIRKYFNGNYSLVSYDRNGGYGDIEHKKINKVCNIIFDSDSARISNFFEATISRDVINSLLKKEFKTLDSKLIPNLSYWDDEFGLEQKDINFCYVLNNSELDTKRKSLESHKTQTDKDQFPLSLDKQGFVSFFGCEYFKKNN